MKPISSRPSRNRGGIAVLPRAGDQGSYDQAMLHMAQQSGGHSVQRTQGSAPGGGGSTVSIKSTPTSSGGTDPSALAELAEVQAEILLMKERLRALESVTNAQPFGMFEVGDEAIQSGSFVTIRDLKLYPCRSTDAARPIISGITMESGTPGQIIKVGVLAGYRYTLEVPMAESSGMVFLGPDAKPAFTPPPVGWFMEAGHVESSTTIYLDPDLAILRS